MKKFIESKIIWAFIALISFTACSNSFLEVDSLELELESNFYKTDEEVWSGVVAAYDPISWEGGSLHTNNANILSMVAGSDEAYSGGASSTDVWWLQTMNNYSLLDAANGPQLGFWQKFYAGVYRTNLILQKINSNDINGLEEQVKLRYIAETKVLRAYYYFSLVRLFKNIPFFTEPISPENLYNLPQVDPKIVYAQIERDLLDAIDESNLPDIVDAKVNGGRVTKGWAHALLGKVYLYQEKWESAVEQLGIVNGNPNQNNRFGYALLQDFSQIFRPDNPFNSESILEISHASTGATWSNDFAIEGLWITKQSGPRSYNGPFYYSGWGGCPLTEDFYEFIKDDPRSEATVIDMNELINNYNATYGKGYLDTGYFMKKFAPLQEFFPTAGVHPLNYPQNYIEIRLADTYLMEAEALVNSNGDLQRASLLLNAVRSRVGLEDVQPTLENIYKERRAELATEGHRWYDLIRTGKAGTVLANKGFVVGKNEILPIPLDELSNTKLEQNPLY